jgi:cellulose synthase/poly-beta-1,6-N-acetylglucosamine synthase-like glycosyltransferase
MIFLKYVFWTCAALMVYAYIGYPFLLGLLSLFSKRKHNVEENAFSPSTSEQKLPPFVTLLISVYNEEKVIEEKIRNSLALEYPKDRLEVVILSDGSTDRTHEIVRRYAKDGVSLLEYPGRIGKTACLNRTMPDVQGDIVLFSDANSIYPADAVKNIVEGFSDSSVGFVTGYTKYRREGEDESTRSIGLYSRIEKTTKALESKIGSCVGADGAIFGIRKELYKPLKETDINDLVIPLSIVRQGYRGILKENVHCIECSAGDIAGEYQRQVRITNRSLRAIFSNADLINPLNSGIFSFFLVSHKLMKYLVPFFLVGLFVSSFGLIYSGTIYTVTFVAQGCLFAIALGSRRKGTTAFSPKIFTLIRDFMIINAAVLQGWLKYMRNERYTTWSPTRR